MRNTTLKSKLIRILLVVAILPVLVAATLNYVENTRNYETLQVEQQQQMEAVVTTQLETARADLKAVVSSLAKEPELVAILQTEERDEIQQKLQPLFEKMQQQHQLVVFEIGDVAGNVHVRAHNFEQYGDSKADLLAIKESLKGKVMSGLEYGKSGLALRAFAPIQVNGAVIGTLQIGVNDQFIQLIEQMLPNVNMYLTNEAGEVQGANESDVLIDEASLARALQGELVRNLMEDAFKMESYIPFYDPTGTRVIGTIMLEQDISTTQQAKDRTVITGGIVLLVTIVAAIIVASYYSRTITNPIKRTAKTMQTLRQGDLTSKIELDNRRDEIGQMMIDMKEMQDHLHETISDVAMAAQTVSSKSSELNGAAQDVSTGSQTIAQIMEGISEGTEQQTNAVLEISQNMTEFSNRLNVVTEQGEQLKHSSNDILSLSTEGSQLMQASSNQIADLKSMMEDVVTKMSLLNMQATKISSFVSIIEEVANQTNLLALNASIEAARAGEHGKGFAIVAEEVRKLAEQVGQSVTEITAIVGAIQADSTNVSDSLQRGYTKVEAGVEQLSHTSATFNDIETAVANMTEAISLIITDLTQMNSESQEMNAALQEMTAINEETTASIEETTATIAESSASTQNVANAADELSTLSEQLNEIVKQYRI